MIHRCQNPDCDKLIERTLYSDGRWETLKGLARRKYCTRSCAASAAGRARHENTLSRPVCNERQADFNRAMMAWKA